MYMIVHNNIRTQLKKKVFDNISMGPSRHLICLYVKMHSYCLIHSITLVLMCSCLFSFILVTPSLQAYEVFFENNWLYEWILLYCIFTYVSVFACIHVFGIALAQSINFTILVTRFDDFNFLLKYGT